MKQFGIFDTSQEIFVHTYCYHREKDFGDKYSGCVHLEITGNDIKAYSWNGDSLDLDENYEPPENSNPTGEDLEIEPILEERFKKRHFNAVDFKRHLKPPNALNKKTEMETDGRPKKAKYYRRNEDETETLVATIDYLFSLDSNTGLVKRRTEQLKYKKKNGNYTPAATIKDKFYDLTDMNELSVVIEERRQGRKFLTSEIKAMLLTVLSLANPTFSTAQVVGIGKVFFTEFKQVIDDFEQMGDESFKDDVAAINIANDYTWLAIEIGPGVSLQDYIVDKLTYTAVSNHPEA